MDETVKVVQVQNDAIVVAQDEYVLDAVTTRLDFEVNANVEFEVAVSAYSIRTNAESRALTAYPLSFVIDENVVIEPHESIISLTYGDLRQDIRVVQQGRVNYGLLSITHFHWNLKHFGAFCERLIACDKTLRGRFLEGRACKQ